MCGIWCCISCEISLYDNWDNTCTSKVTSCCICSGDSTNLIKRQQEFISRRGPDSSGHQCFKISDHLRFQNDAANEGCCPMSVHMTSNVLWTQGKEVCIQPYINVNEDKLMLYNGDLYSFNGSLETGTCPNAPTCFPDHNDGRTLFHLLENCQDSRQICDTIGNLQGPFAFIYMDKTNEKLWFARDFFGRESLLFSYETTPNNSIINWNLSSVSLSKAVLEVPASGLFCVELKTRKLQIFPYSHPRKNVNDLQSEFISFLKSSGFIYEATVNLDESSLIRLNFSTKIKRHADVEGLTNILNLANASLSSELFIKDCVATLSETVQLFENYLRDSVVRRVSTLPPSCKNCLSERIRHPKSSKCCDHSKVGVLFSGGIDSAVLAYLAADSLPLGSTLDLINVAFSKNEDFSKIPDRETAIASYNMLKERFEPQGKKINLVLVNVSKAEVEEKRQAIIRDLISPLKSVLDDSVGVCLWFASRGIGKLYIDTSEQCYISPVRVVLLGSGADEVLGGYSRHRSAYEKSGWAGLATEMQLDIDRISVRNSGRDNRIVSDHGICPRMPFLDENVVNFLTSKCDLWTKCCPANVGPLGTRGIGEKLLLRVLAARLFGDKYLSLALFPKRAMQFGSRIAKLENSKEKGGDSCQRLLYGNAT